MMLSNKSETSQSKLFLLASFGVTFLLLYTLLSYNNRLATDDYFYFKNLNDHGIWNGMVASYSTWVSRWFAILFLNVVLKSYNLFHSLLPYHLFTIVALTMVVMNFIRAVAERFLQTTISYITLLLYSILLVASFYFFSFSISETWFWIAATTMYLWGIIFFIAGITFILRPGNKLLNQICCACCFLFIGGASESMAIHILTLLAAGILYILYQNKFSLQSFWKGKSHRMIFISALSLLLALLISYSGHGRVLRQSALPDTGIFSSFLVTVKSLVKLILFQLPLKIHWFIFFAVPWIFLGHQFESEKKESLEKIFKRLVIFFLAFLLLSFISFIPASLFLGETGPYRTWIPVSLYLSLCCMVCGFYLGYKAEWNKKLLNRTFSAATLTLIVLMIINIISQKEITSMYSSAVDKRMSDLRELKEKGEKNTIALDALPPSGMLYSSEISADSSYFSNQHLKNFLDLKFDIRKR